MEHAGYGVMAYATAWEGRWHADTYVGVARHDYEMSRITGVNLATEIDAAPGAVQSLVGVQAGYDFEPIEGLTVSPTIGLDYSSLRLDGYREMGAGEFALEVQGRTLDSLTVESAVQFAYQPFNEGRAAAFAAYGRIGYVTELGDGADLVRANFLGVPEAAFDIARDLDREWVSASGGVSYQFGDDITAHLEAVSDIGRGVLSSTSVQAGFSLRF
jgi:outer membrane autotransporter protein